VSQSIDTHKLVLNVPSKQILPLPTLLQDGEIDSPIIIIIIFINCKWVDTRWQWLFYVYTECDLLAYDDGHVQNVVMSSTKFLLFLLQIHE
jgi:hypothetical protein